jgi:hypothetical protein
MLAVKSKAKPGLAIEAVEKHEDHGSVNHGYTMKTPD